MSAVAGGRLQRFHVTSDARERYGLTGTLFGRRGDLVLADPVAVRRLAARMNRARATDAALGPPTVAAGEILALGLIHEVFHAVVERFAESAGGELIEAALAAATDQLGEAGAAAVLDAFGAQFEAPDGAIDGAATASTVAAAAPADRFEELLLIRVANENPAAAPIIELVDDRPLARSAAYATMIAAAEASLAAGPAIGPAGETLLELLRAPARAAPTSLPGQLRWIQARWGDLVGELLDRILRTLDVITEEERGLHLRFGGGHQGGAGGRIDPPSYLGLDAEVERFSADADWMPRVVMIAKSTYVWLDQLSKRYGREIRTLDAIPDEELERLAGWGVSSLWLIGLWQRSRASERIKRRRGNVDAVASAYSLDDYRIADDLGGEAAWTDLRDRAWARGVRLASDMVPNHMGIDSRWVIEHPEWFLSLDRPPYPSYTFGGPDLSDDPRVGIFLEDHYWDNSDASVVFRRQDRATSEDRFVYHGNDGTSFPWNDTAQLDFLRADVREQVIRTIVDVARRFPIIRFDAAMVLARKHVQRLWWPEPGAGGAIPSRAEHGIPRDEFERLMPTEFWREVVDRVAAEAPDTLLLAEAFWLLEGYFVRTLGMHRVYNSAFMHMLRDEDGAGFRKLVRDTLEFDPEILQRYVNFMSNPDEATAIEQFGKGDKYVGVATVLATLPGLPMLGHGQVEGFTEKYGMEYQRAQLDEQPDPWLIERHEREIFPLFHRRGQFAAVRDFRLYDLVRDDGSIDEGVLAYSNGRGAGRSLVVYHVRYASTSGRLHAWVPFAEKSAGGAGGGVKSSRGGTLGEALGLPAADDVVVGFRDLATGLEHLRTARELLAGGLWVALDAYGRHVFLDFRDIHDPSGVWRRLAERLGGRGVPSLADALRDVELEPVHSALEKVLGSAGARRLILGEAAGPGERGGGLAGPIEAFYREVVAATGASGDVAAATRYALAMLAVERPARAASGGAPGGDPTARRNAIDGAAGQEADSAAAGEAAGPSDGPPDGPVAGSPTVADATELERRATWLGVALLEAAGRLGSAADTGLTARAWYDELRLRPAVATALRDLGLDKAGAERVAGRLHWLVGVDRPSRHDPPAGAAAVARAWLSDPAVRAALGVNRWEGVEYLDGDALTEVVTWATALEPAPGGDLTALPAVAKAAGYRVDAFLTELGRGGRR